MNKNNIFFLILLTTISATPMLGSQRFSELAHPTSAGKDGKGIPVGVPVGVVVTAGLCGAFCAGCCEQAGREVGSMTVHATSRILVGSKKEKQE